MSVAGTWNLTIATAQSITRPMRLNLAFNVTVNGDGLVGTSKAGRLPTSTVTDHRAPATRAS